jgi:hypothetical protein
MITTENRLIKEIKKLRNISNNNILKDTIVDPNSKL